MSLPVIFDQLSPEGRPYRGSIRVAGWKLLGVYRGHPMERPPIKDEAGLEAVRKELMRIGREPSKSS